MKNFSEVPLVGIIRGAPPDAIVHVCEAAAMGGFRTLEITLNSPEPFEQIARAREALSGTVELGAGTVLTVEEARKALDAGAEFLVTPTVIPEVIRFCLDKEVPVVAGTMTPTESFQAHKAGVTMVKVFPAVVLGPDYLRLLHGPFPDLRLLPTGGVNLDNAVAFLKAGAEAVGISSELFRREWMEGGDWKSLEREASRFVKAVTEAL